MKKDIQSKDDISLMVHQFYTVALNDPHLSRHFKELDLAKHMPNMVAFWSFVLLDEAGYSTNVFDKHRHLSPDKLDFERWLEHFKTTVNSLFEGPKAELAMQRAEVIAYTFEAKFKEINRSMD